MEMRRSEGAQSHEARTAAYLRRRRVNHIAAITLVAILTTTVIAAHRGRLFADDARLNHRTFLVTDTPAADIIRIRADDHDQLVQLLGVAAPHGDEHFAGPARLYTSNRLVGKRVTLLLEPPQTRNAAGHLLAYVFPFDVDNLNVDIVKDGMAYADRRINTLMSPTLAQCETDARKRSRGLWRGLKDSGMPQWRRDWRAAMRTRG